MILKPLCVHQCAFVEQDHEVEVQKLQEQLSEKDSAATTLQSQVDKLQQSLSARSTEASSCSTKLEAAVVTIQV